MPPTSSLPSLVRAQFKAAQESGALKFFPSQVAIMQCAGVPFQCRFSPALANKPKAAKDPKSKPIDPFEAPSKQLFITDIGPDHYIVLNKFPVNPEHFILATKEFKYQNDMLEEEDFAAAWMCLQSYREAGEKLFGFFNSGEHSGASQPHRHIQFLPVESMRGGIEPEKDWDLLADKLDTEPRLPFQYFAHPLPENPSSTFLVEQYHTLLSRASALLLRHFPDSLTKPTREHENQFSYNLGLTDRVMVLCPRLSEGCKIQGKSHDMIGPIGLNGTVLGGTLLAKTEDEWNALRGDESKLLDVLSSIGIPQTRTEEGRL